MTTEQTTMTKKCRGCGEELIPDVNWNKSRQKRYDYICTRCKSSDESKRARGTYRARANAAYNKGIRRGAVAPEGVSAVSFYPVAKDAMLFQKYGYVIHLDHIIPVAAAGCQCPSNLQSLGFDQHMQKSREDRRWVWLHNEVYGDNGAY